MLSKVQKETLILLFILSTTYPAFRVYGIYRGNIKHVIEKTGDISEKISRSFVDTLKRKQEADTFRLNLNEVSWEALTLIPGIGEHTARKIITYRMKHGNFRRVEDILKIKGIGKSTLKKLRPYVYVK